MVKSEEDVVKDFNELVNMTADELDAFLKTEGSESTGWSKSDGSGESVGHESGRKIVDILQRNPSKDPSEYTEEDKEHMRRVVSYCKRHLAQEAHLKETKSPEELEKTKSTRSLKNWGHDPLKSDVGGKPPSKKAEKPKSSGKPQSKKADKPKSTGNPVSKKAEEPASMPEQAEKADKPKSSGKPRSKKSEAAQTAVTEKPKSKGARKTADDAETGEKRTGEEKSKGEKPPSKKAKTTKEPVEPTRKPPSRGAKKV
ncbi:hypothetical protein JCM24511_03519 [Saitozyma sp. JCM 24511]|nr:hypothetical protein JCM24511_03519 [Saitozyma sp. JCM 24511]